MIEPPPRLIRDPFTLSCGALAWNLEPLTPETSLQVASNEMAEQGFPVLPVIENSKLIGAISEKSIRDALAEGAEPTEKIESFLEKSPPTILNVALGAEALRQMTTDNLEWLIVIDGSNEPVGVITPARLIAGEADRTFKGRVGGMATPFGVYLTNGVVFGGASRWALVATGAVMSILFHASATLVLVVQNNLPKATQDLPITAGLAQFFWMALFFVGLRSLPLAGTHGAEHMVVHALERGEILKPEVVRRMPRVHPRCGTNLAVGAMIFLTVLSINAIKDEQLKLLLAFLVTIVLWQPIGSFFQQFVTTKPPTEAQIEGAIFAAEQLKSRQQTASFQTATVLRRLAMSGMFQVMVGGMAVALVVAAIYEVLRIPAQWRVS